MKWFFGINNISTCSESSYRNFDCNLLFALMLLLGLIIIFGFCLYSLREIFDVEKINRRITKPKTNDADIASSITNQWSPTTFVNESLPPDLAVQIQKRLKTMNRSKRN